MDELKNINNVLLKTSEIVILNRYGINVNELSSLDEAILLIDRFLNDAFDLTDEEYEELDYVASNIAERKYYMETHK